MAKVVRMTAVYNEIDVLPLNVDWYHREGISTVVVDNGSTDGSWEYCCEALETGKLAELERLPTEEFEWAKLLTRLHALAREQRPDWLMLAAPDEFFEPADGGSLGAALQEDILSGCNLIKFYNMEFWMTDRDDEGDANPLTRMRYYSCYDVDMYRAYPNLDGIDFVTPYGHRPIFPEVVSDRPSPRVYVSRHYKLRNVDQALRKIRRIRPNRSEPNAHVHYLNYTGDPGEFRVPHERLHRYDFDHRWSFEGVFDGRRGIARKTKLPAR